MKRFPFVGLLALFLCLPALPVAIAAGSPHVSMDACPVCHIAIPSPDDADNDQFRLHKSTIDETCRMCHADTACALGLGRVVHPSGIDEWNRHVCDGPKTLPLYDGRITCATCHYHLKPVGPDFKMVRNVKFFDGQPDLSAFCADCHEEFY